MIASMRTPLMHRLAGDDVLAARAGGGDDLAFATLVGRLQPRLLAYCATILGNVSDADDAVQNTFIRAHDGLRAGDHVLAVRPWLYRIAHNEGSRSCAVAALQASWSPRSPTTRTGRRRRWRSAKRSAPCCTRSASCPIARATLPAARGRRHAPRRGRGGPGHLARDRPAGGLRGAGGPA